MTELERLEQLLDEQEGDVRRAFLAFIRTVNSGPVLDLINARLEAGDLAGAIAIVDSYLARLGTVLTQVFQTAGIAAAAELGEKLGEVAVAISFDATNPRAAEIARANRARFVTEMTREQREAISQAISREVRVGRGAIQVGRAFRSAIGLTTTQESMVASFRRQLETLDKRALDRALRDARFDAILTRAIDRDRALTERQINTMVERYRARALSMRAETIARTEAVRALSLAREEALAQMMAATGLGPDRINRIWNATGDERTRDWHASMHGQRRKPGERFVDGQGSRLLYPGDPAAPLSTTINCRCTLTFEVLPAA